MNHKDINAAFYYTDGRWEYGSRLPGSRNAEAALDQIKSGVELLKKAVLEAEEMQVERSHEYLEIVLACHGPKVKDDSRTRTDHGGKSSGSRRDPAIKTQGVPGR